MQAVIKTRGGETFSNILRRSVHFWRTTRNFIIKASPPFAILTLRSAYYFPIELNYIKMNALKSGSNRGPEGGI